VWAITKVNNFSKEKHSWTR